MHAPSHYTRYSSEVLAPIKLSKCRSVLLPPFPPDFVSLQRRLCESTLSKPLGIHTQRDLRPGKYMAAGRRLGQLVVVLSKALYNRQRNEASP